MDVLWWQQLSEIKAGMLNVACALSDDEIYDRKEAASKLLEFSKRMHDLENMCLRHLG